jgi:hypothetical protein
MQIPPISGKDGDPIENSGPSNTSFHGKLGLPSFDLEGSIPLKHMKSIPNIFPNLSLGANRDCVRNSVPELPNSSLLPNFMVDISGTSKQKSLMSGLLPGLGLNLVQPMHPAMPENHKKVLDNIMMRAQYASSKFLKKRSKLDYWSEDELDALWIGVRRHGRGNWDAMLRDPKLKFLNNRTSEGLASRWILEEQKIIEEPLSTAATRSSNSASFPGISDAMMSRALSGSNFSKMRMEQPKLQSHLTDIQLGSSDILSRFPHIESAKYMNTSEGGPPQMPWQDFKHRSTYGGDFPGSAFDKSEKPEIGSVPPFMPNPFMNETICSLPINRKNNSSIQQSEIGSSSRENILLPGVSDGQINMFHEMQHHIMLGKQPIEMNLNHTNHSNSLLENSSDFRSSKSNKLPHWLQEAVRAPSSKPPECELPTTVSAIAQSVCLLLGQQEPAIPPFWIPGPRLSRPKDPRITSKKRTLRKVQQHTSQFDHSKITSSQCDEYANLSTPQFTEASSIHPTVDGSHDGTPSVNLNTQSSSSAGSLGQDELHRVVEESHQTVEGEEAAAAAAATATCLSKPEVPDCQRTGSSVADDKTSRSHKSSAEDTTDSDPQGGTLSGSDNLAPAVSALPILYDAPDTCSGATVAPSMCVDEDVKQENPLDNEGGSGNDEAMDKSAPLEESRDSIPMEQPALESKDSVAPLEESRVSETTEKHVTHENKFSDASCSVSDEVVDQDKVVEIISDEH